MKYKLLRLSLLSMLMMLCGNVFAEFKDFEVIVNNQEGTMLTSNELVQGTSVEFGVAVASDGTVSRVAAGDATSVATISGNYHSDHGLTGMKVVVPVDGNVTIIVGQCTYSGSEIKVTNSAGTTVVSKTPTTACWKNDHNNVTELTYAGEPTTLTISGMSYCPYIAVKALDVVINKHAVSYSLGSETAQGILPTGSEIVDGESITIPANYTLFKEGSTLTGWTDGSKTYAAGETVTPTGDLTLTPVFTANTVSLADRTEAVTVNWNLEPQADVPAIKLEGKTGFRVAQASVNGNIIDVKMDIDATSGKLNNDGRSSWCQANKGTKFTLPSCKGATVAMKGYSAFGADGKTATTIDGQSEYTSSTDLSYEIASKNETVEVVLGDDCGYLSYIKIVLPVVESEVKERAIIDTDFQDWTKSSTQSIISTNFSNEEITFTYVNTSVDPEATNEGKFPTSTDAAYKGYILADKKEATVTTSLFKNITKIRYRHGATGSNRGWGLKIKVGDGEWQIISDATTGSTAWVEKDINANNVQLQWYNLNTGQNAYMFELEVYANVEISAEQVTLTTTVSPENAGTVSVYPNSSEYDKDTEVKLTATDNFGYNFKQWTKDGEVLGTEPVLNYIIAETSTITAEFEKTQTYELKLDVEGTNSYMVAINPEPTIVDGKKMYEEGTTVTLTASSYEGLVTFNNWSDGQTSSEITLTMTEDKDITAVYSESDIIAGWDFFTSGGNGRVADFASEENTAAALSLVNTESGETSAWLDKSTEAAGGYESMKGAAVNWRQGSTEGDVGNWHWQTKVNAEAFSDINVQFDMLYNFNAYQTYNVEYSLDGESWESVGSITMTGPKAVASFNKSLPADANNQPVLYIRMIADKNSKIDGSSSKNDGNALAMFFITGSPKLIDDGQAPVLVSTVPVDGATGVSASGKIVLTFDERVKLNDGVVAYINNSYIKSNTQNPTKGIVNGKTITFEYKDFEYDTPYNFILAGKSVADLTDNYITEAITLSFTTMARPTVEKALYDFVVPDDGTLKAAIDAANSRDDKSARYRIFVKKGEHKLPTGANKHYKHTNNDGYVYWEGDLPDPITYVTAANISLIGEDRDATIVTQDISNDDDMLFQGQYGPAHKYEEIKNSAVLQLEGSATGMYFQDITIKSGINDALGRNLAVYDKSSKNIYKNTLLYGYQDTWTSDNNQGLYYFEDGQVRGRTDYLCGKGDAYFNGVELLQVAGGYAAVPSTPANVGWVFNGCTISESGSGVNSNYTLGRPWGQGTPVAVFIDTKMNVLPSPIGWNEMSKGWPKRFAEYNSMTASGSIVDLSERKKTFGDGHTNDPVLTEEEAAQYRDMNNMFGDWNPKLQTEQAPVPTNVKIDGTTLTWDNSNYVFCWAVCKDGNVVGFATEPSYTISGEGTWTVRAANEMGGLSEASAEASDASGILLIEKANDKTISELYNIAGQRVKKATKGIYIINGKKIQVR
ncbi:MAG: Ig-like domain-containing protein [Prevotella sp.]|nr:Ig-like domain-containing protein [Prevotella sp.]